MMPMYFFVSDQVILLFDFWNVHSVAGMVLTVVIVLLMTLSYEILKVETVKLDKKILDLMTATPNTQDETAETLPINPNAQNTSLKREETFRRMEAAFIAACLITYRQERKWRRL
ncbi:probable low affinity copper uptake protein 2 isoform X3 [Carcharodon carcharias]|uniref:probable low affinity copper uptake protein 2 isoform X3 n=1 Tax=Carcharodon carcharias TaxID=13397 RepID=UPI001B7F650A|nr:probable low affinity copper uptake protein 2 isoform X3 [Carcharodon carcharias]